MTVYGYVRTSTEDQVHGLASQEDRLRAEAAHRGFSPFQLVHEHASARDLVRPELSRLLAGLRPGDTLVVTDVDRLARSVLDFTTLLTRAHDEGWSLVVLNLLDMTTPEGEFMANVLASVAQLERRLISRRTSDALRAAQARGVRVGRPPDTRFDDTVQSMRDAGGPSFAVIARRMTALTGETWHPSRARRAYRRRIA